MHWCLLDKFRAGQAASPIILSVGDSHLDLRWLSKESYLAMLSPSWELMSVTILHRMRLLQTHRNTAYCRVLYPAFQVSVFWVAPRKRRERG